MFFYLFITGLRYAFFYSFPLIARRTFVGYFLPMLFKVVNFIGENVLRETSTSTWEEYIQDQEFKNMNHFVYSLLQLTI